MKKNNKLFHVKFGEKALGEAIIFLQVEGFTREIQCYPEGVMILNREELKAITTAGILPSEINGKKPSDKWTREAIMEDINRRDA